MAYTKAVRAAALPWNQRREQRAAASTNELGRPADADSTIGMRIRMSILGTSLTSAAVGAVQLSVWELSRIWFDGGLWIPKRETKTDRALLRSFHPLGEFSCLRE